MRENANQANEFIFEMARNTVLCLEASYTISCQIFGSTVRRI